MSPPAETDEFHDPAPLPDGPEVVKGYENAAPAAAVQPTGEAAPPATPPTSLTRDALDAFVKKGPRHALTLLQIKPAFSGTTFVGYEVVGFTPEGSALFGAALEPGDVVTKVNEHGLARPEDYMEAWKSLEKCTTIKVELVRNGAPQTQSFPVGG